MRIENGEKETTNYIRPSSRQGRNIGRNGAVSHPAPVPSGTECVAENPHTAPDGTVTPVRIACFYQHIVPAGTNFKPLHVIIFYPVIRNPPTQ
jgi:hypothetical protein